MQNKILWNTMTVFLIAAICFTVATFLTDYALPMRIAQMVCNSVVLVLLVVWIIIDIRKTDKQQKENIEQLKKQIKIIEDFKKQENTVEETKIKKSKKKS